ncbi:GntR family transcriptional regulator [Mobilisporobacter senegalensis]|uniref:GntR family transcriptional regulator n=1 Tax=Mobilisporobacter senegalensis TaxID=1329262 RepID=A0A3N1XGB8_9FIRM|nr:GntR family transcriptional regulator [Mobilisporobacter senegalensis]ROR25759.1 GntR family transcriptional regulator [Mobilisporobacter senegalensis]
MDIIISNSNENPIYEQIYSQIKNLILNGTLKEGEALPSMRSLAKDLRISVITTKRAYEELERDGFIETVTGKGSFVGSNNFEFIKEEHFKIVEESLSNAIEIAKLCDYGLEQMIEYLTLLYQEK